ncbi:MAG: hypothetical protein MJ237_00935 [bacterium]|nr:hypothetical protein [bacterium]
MKVTKNINNLFKKFENISIDVKSGKECKEIVTNQKTTKRIVIALALITAIIGCNATTHTTNETSYAIFKPKDMTQDVEFLLNNTLAGSMAKTWLDGISTDNSPVAENAKTPAMAKRQEQPTVIHTLTEEEINEIRESFSKDLFKLKRIEERKLLGLKNANGNLFDSMEIFELERLSDKEWGNVEKRKLLELKYADGEPFDVWDISTLAKLSDKEWKNVRSHDLLKLKDAKGYAFYGSSIYGLSTLSDTEWMNVEKRKLLELKNITDDALSGWDISHLAKLSDKEWINVEKRKLLELKNIRNNALSGWDISELAKLSDEEFTQEIAKGVYKYQ